MPRCPNGTHRSRKTGSCSSKSSRSRTTKRSRSRTTKRSRSRTTKRYLVASRKTISDEDLDEIIRAIHLNETKLAELESMRPTLKQMKFSKSYKSCFTGKPTKNLEAMIQDKIFCWSKYGDAM